MIVSCSSCPKIPQYRLHLDYAVPFDGRMLLVLVDASNKWTEIVLVKEANLRSTILALESSCSRNLACFTSDDFKAFCENHGITYIFSFRI